MIKRLFCIVSFLFLALSPLQAQRPATDFTGVTTDNSEFRLSEATADKYVLLNFTSNYCGYCWRIYPYLIMMQQEYEDELLIVCVHNVDSDSYGQWEAMARRYYGDDADKVIDRELLTLWQASYLSNDYSDPSKDGWPHFFLINHDGEIVKKWFGANEKKLIKNLEKELER